MENNEQTANAIEELIKEIENQRTTMGGIILDGRQTDRLLVFLKSLLMVIQQQYALIQKLDSMIRGNSL